MVAIEVRADELEAIGVANSFDAKFIAVNIGSGGTSKTVLSSAIAVLTLQRYSTDVPKTAIA